MKKRLSLHLLAALTLAVLSGCATTRDSIDDDALYRAQDRTFRPMGN